MKKKPEIHHLDKDEIDRRLSAPETNEKKPLLRDEIIEDPDNPGKYFRYMIAESFRDMPFRPPIATREEEAALKWHCEAPEVETILALLEDESIPKDDRIREAKCLASQHNEALTEKVDPRRLAIMRHMYKDDEVVFIVITGEDSLGSAEYAILDLRESSSR
jgi:hypothetical protein